MVCRLEAKHQLNEEVCLTCKLAAAPQSGSVRCAGGF